MPYIKTISEADATGELAELYRRLAYQDGTVDDAYKVLSLNPALLAADAAMYQATMYGEPGLSRAERELIALTVSRLNGCERCLRHHGARYRQLIRGELPEPGAGPGPALSARDRALVSFAQRLTETPADVTAAEVEALRTVGFTDRDILDACNVVAYFNYANRVTLGLGLGPATEPPGVRPGRTS